MNACFAQNGAPLILRNKAKPAAVSYFLCLRRHRRGASHWSERIEKVDHILLLPRAQRLEGLGHRFALPVVKPDSGRNITGASIVQVHRFAPDAPQRRRPHHGRSGRPRSDAVAQRADLVQQKVRVGMERLMREDLVQRHTYRHVARGRPNERSRIGRGCDAGRVAARSAHSGEQRRPVLRGSVARQRRRRRQRAYEVREAIDVRMPIRAGRIFNPLPGRQLQRQPVSRFVHCALADFLTVVGVGDAHLVEISVPIEAAQKCVIVFPAEARDMSGGGKILGSADELLEKVSPTPLGSLVGVPSFRIFLAAQLSLTNESHQRYSNVLRFQAPGKIKPQVIPYFVYRAPLVEKSAVQQFLAELLRSGRGAMSRVCGPLQ